MPKVILSILLLFGLAGVILFWVSFRVEREYENGQPVSIRIIPRSEGLGLGLSPPWRTVETVARPIQPTFRVLSFHVNRLDDRKLSQRRAAEILSRLTSQFELIALQGLEGANRGEALQLVEALNKSDGGRKFDYAASPISPNGKHPQYMAFLFDPTALEIDRTSVRTIEGASDALAAPPLAAQFRVRGPPPVDAFTFQLISVCCDPQRVAEGVNVLADVYRAVRDDGRNEDDIIMVGDFGADENNLGRLGSLPDMVAVIHNAPTMIRAAWRTDNILFNRRATVEFTGRGEVFDLIRTFDLSLDEALKISEHLPVWAEFGSFEGGQPGLLATSAAGSVP